MKNLFLTSLIASLFITGCAKPSNHSKNTKPIDSKSKLISLSNEGTICAYKKSKKEVVVKYYPLSLACVSSSKIDWKLVGFDTSLKGGNLKIDSYALYRKNNSDIATADCAGARVTVKKLIVPATKTNLYWDSKKLIELPENGNVVCFKKVGQSIESVKPFGHTYYPKLYP